MSQEEDNNSRNSGSKQSFWSKFSAFFASGSEKTEKDKELLVDYNRVFEEAKKKRKAEQNSQLYSRAPKPKYAELEKGQESLVSEPSDPVAEAEIDDQTVFSRPDDKQEAGQEIALGSESVPRPAKPRKKAKQSVALSDKSAKPEKNDAPKSTGADFWRSFLDWFKGFSFHKPVTTDTLKTNLIDGGGDVTFDYHSNLKVFGISLVLALSVVGFLYGGLVYWESRIDKRADDLAQEVDRLNQVIAAKEGKVDQTGRVQEKTDVVAGLLDRHIYWTRFFSFLEENTLPEVYYSNDFSGNTDGSYSLSAVTDNYSSIAEQVALFNARDEVIKAQVASGDLSVEVASQDEAGSRVERTETVSFTLSLEINPSVFYRSGQE
jgi:hypothetical protein